MPILEQLPLTEAIRQWPVWGTTARLVVTRPEVADDAQRLVQERLLAIDQACSRFRDDSELAVVQRRLRGHPARSVPVTTIVDDDGLASPVDPPAVVLTPLLADLVRSALAAAELSDGDVDPTLADDLAALGYDLDFTLLTAAGPVPVRVARRVRHRWTDVRLEGDLLSMPPGVRLDLGASAKAFAADTGAALVHERLGCGVLLSLGGDIATAGPSPDGWSVLVQDGPDQPGARIRLDAGGLATSSTLSRRWRTGSRTVHHILDPATGEPADEVWCTVSVAAPTCQEANALSTQAVVRGGDALERLRHSGFPARLVSRAGQIVRLGGWP